MIADELEDSVSYLYLSRHFRGKAAAMLQAMSRQEQAHASYLKGIYAMFTGQRPRVHTAPAPRIAPQLLLRQCYTKENQCHARYQAHCNHPEYGKVFSRFANQELEHCQNLLLLLGNPKK
jgi:rubrerythrin